MNHITIELCQEDRQRLDEIIGFLGWIVKPGTIPQDAAAEHPADAPITHLEPPAAEPAAEDPVPEVKVVSLAEFQKAVTQTVAKGAAQKKAAKEIINQYATSVSAVPEDKRAEVMDALAKI